LQGTRLACATLRTQPDGFRTRERRPGGCSRGHLEYPPKNAKARVVALPPVACEELRAALTAQKEYRLAKGGAWNHAGRVVPKKDGTQMAPSSLKSQWWDWVARQGIDPHLPIHGLRDMLGTWVYETNGVKQTQEWLGHSDPAA
jgi:integrase